MGLEIIGEDTPLSWKEFEEIVKSDIKEVKFLRSNTENKMEYGEIVFRGQSNSNWSLETTLERYLRIEFGLNRGIYEANSYYDNISAIIPDLNTLSVKNFNRFSPHDIKHNHLGSLPEYELLCYVRHLGFPSPMLDWSQSLYIATYFAYRDAKNGEDVAVYSYRECWEQGRGTWGDQSIIKN